MSGHESNQSTEYDLHSCKNVKVLKIYMVVLNATPNISFVYKISNGYRTYLLFMPKYNVGSLTEYKKENLYKDSPCVAILFFLKNWDISLA